MKKRIGILLICLITVLLTVLNVSANGENLTTDGSLLIGGIPVTAENAENITGAGITGKVTYDKESTVLTLENAVITADCGKDTVCGIACEGIAVLNITVGGKCEISLPASDGKDTSGIFAPGTELSFTGDGTLKITVPDTSSGNSDGIRCAGLTADENVTIEIIGGKAAERSTGIFIEGGSLLTAGNIIATGGEAADSRGLYLDGGSFGVVGGKLELAGNTSAVKIGTSAIVQPAEKMKITYGDSADDPITYFYVDAMEESSLPTLFWEEEYLYFCAEADDPMQPDDPAENEPESRLGQILLTAGITVAVFAAAIIAGIMIVKKKK